MIATPVTRRRPPGRSGSPRVSSITGACAARPRLVLFVIAAIALGRLADLGGGQIDNPIQLERRPIVQVHVGGRIVIRSDW